MLALRLPWMPLIRRKLREFRVRISGKKAEGQGLIGANPHEVAKGFAALTGDDFATYNFPQVWVERRQMPRAIDGKIPVKNAVVLDLGCGPGTSTDVLCYFADPSWKIIGFDLTQASIDMANARAERMGFHNKRGQVIAPQFVCQDIADPLMGPDARPLADESAHFAISGGVVGLYMNDKTVAQLARELARVIKPGGHAALDSGPAVPRALLRSSMEAEGFSFVHLAKSVAVEPRPKLVFRKTGR